jgi:uncharacterized protein YcfJ
MKVHNVIPTYLIKQSFDTSVDPVMDTPLKDFKPNNPNQTGLAGAALGALAAGGGAYLGTSLFDSLNDSPRPRTSKIKRALMAALIGAGVGGAAGYAGGSMRRNRLTNETMDKITQQTAGKEMKVGDKVIYSLSPKAGDREMIQDKISQVPLGWSSDTTTPELTKDKQRFAADIVTDYLRNNKGLAPSTVADLIEKQMQIADQMQNQNKLQ